MNTIKQELQDYLSNYYPDIDLKTEQTLCGPVTVRFNTTEKESAEFIDRINQGVERATQIWNEMFPVKTLPLWVVAYEYFGEQMIEFDPEYFFEQFALPNNFISIREIFDMNIFSSADSGEETVDKVEGRIILGKISPNEINIASLLRGIANRDGGIDPMVGQSVYFFDPNNNTGFHMYDDRGFFIWSTEAESIKELYDKHFDWIPEYALEDIQPFFN